MRGITDAARRAAFAALALLLLPGQAVADDEAEAFAAVRPLLVRRCAISGCHAGPEAPKGLRLEGDRIYRSTVNVPARTTRALLVAPGDPSSSLLYRKLLDPEAGDYNGPRMPLDFPSFEPGDLELVRAWIASFPADRWPRPAAEKETRARAGGTFLDGHLVNLPSPDPPGHRTMEFRVAHRFKSAIDDAGNENLYGLDTGAWVSLGLSYGLGSAWEVGLRHTNFQKANEAWAKYTPVRQGRAPVSLALRGGVSHLRETGRANRTRYSGQLLVARRWDRVAVLLAPTYVTRANYINANDADGTLALGVGGELRFNRHLALVAEWVGPLSGVEDGYDSGSLALRMSTGLHCFDLVLTNTRGIHTDLYAPGGDLEASDGHVRLGFNITRRSRPTGLHGP